MHDATERIIRADASFHDIAGHEIILRTKTLNVVPLRLEQMAGVPAAGLGALVASAVDAEDRIAVALNKLLFYV